MRTKTIMFTALLVVILLLLSACGGKTDKDATPPAQTGEVQQPNTPAQEPEKETPPAKPDPVTLKFAYSQTWLGEGEYEAYFLEPVKKRYPHITLEVINLSNPDTAIDKLAITGTIPDIVQSANPIIYTFTDTGMADNIEPLIKKHNFDLSKLNSAAVESVKIATGDDFLTGLPWTMHFNATYYNVDLFDKFGADYPFDGMTWEEARELAVKLTRNEDGVQYRGLEPDVPSRMASIFSMGYLDTKTNKATLNNDTWKKVFEYIKSVYDIPGNETYRWVPASNNQFMVEKTLAMLPGLNLLPNFKDIQDLNWDMAQFPQFKELPNTGNQVDEWILHVTKQSKHKDEAFQVIATVLSEEVQMEIARNARFPIVSSPKIQEEFGKNRPHLEGKNLQVAFKTQPATAIPATKLSGIGSTISQQAFTKVMKEGVDINTALNQADEELNLKIQEALAAQK